MLELRPNCECCDKDLPPDATDAVICSFECTFCADCAENRLRGRCPNCGGNLTPRPIRPADKLADNPPSPNRIFKPEGCWDRAPVARPRLKALLTAAPLQDVDLTRDRDFGRDVEF